MNRHSVLAIIAAVAIGRCLLTAPALAWNPSGHMIIALIAYDKLDDATKAKAVELLRAHPRFPDHFQHFMPKDVVSGSKAEQDQWCFAYAATWPDVMREAKSVVTRDDVSKYHRALWHYVDIPIYLNDDEQHQSEHNIKMNLSRDLPENPDDPTMNVIQAVKTSARIVGDAHADKEQRAVYLCWLLHLVGDSHQPLHSSALFTTHRFRGGDHGGNFLEPEYNYKLHAYWDDAISTDDPYSTCRILAYDLESNKELLAAGEKATATLDVGDWIDESHELCKRYVYTPEVKRQVAAREGHSHLGQLDLTPTYKADAENIAERRAVEAGSRLAKMLKQLLQ